jgi:hypothetical protein
MKTLFLLLITVAAFCTHSFAQSEDYPLSNPFAGTSTYDYNLKINDTVSVLDQAGVFKTMKVYEKKNSLYKVAKLDVTAWELKNDQSACKWYKCNSVYPYYDMKSFQAKTSKYKNTIASLLNCMSEDKKIPLSSLTGINKWPTYYIKDDNEYNSMKADLENCKELLKTFKFHPNTFMGYENNPVIWVAVVNDGIKYLDCLKAVGNPDIIKAVNKILSEIAVAKTNAQNFKGGEEGLYNCSGCYQYYFNAVSANERKDWFARRTDFNSDIESVKKINAAFDDLKPLAASKIPLVKPTSLDWKYSAAGLETVMKNHLKNSASLTYYKIGSGDADWQIEKSSAGIPLYRYKRTYMWIKNPSNDHPYCKSLAYVIKQEYSGGGTYAGSTVSEYNEGICGCP